MRLFLRNDAVGGIDPDADAEGRTAASCDYKVVNNFYRKVLKIKNNNRIFAARKNVRRNIKYL